MTKAAKYQFGTGRRKSAVAQVRIYDGSGKFVNFKKQDKQLESNFIEEISEPLKLISAQDKYDVSFIVDGGGKNSQKEAIVLALSRALSKTSEEIEKKLKKANLLSRDPREKERKKPGLKRARRAPQWAKR